MYCPSHDSLENLPGELPLPALCSPDCTVLLCDIPRCATCGRALIGEHSSPYPFLYKQTFWEDAMYGEQNVCKPVFVDKNHPEF